MFELFVGYFQVNFKKIIDNGGVKIEFIGRIDKLPDEVFKSCIEIREMSSQNKDLTVILALNYSGRQEIVDAVNKILNQSKEQVSIEDINENLYLSNVPYPDLIIRTAGEKKDLVIFFFGSRLMQNFILLMYCGQIFLVKNILRHF